MFNVQSDAIVAIEKNSTNVLFNNKKSVSLFEYDFETKNDGEDSQEHSKLEVKRFLPMEISQNSQESESS